MKILYCGGNQLSNIDISNNLNLEILGSYDNQLTNIDISNNDSLINLELQNNELTSVYLNNNSFLEYIDIIYIGQFDFLDDKNVNACLLYTSDAADE